MSYLGTKPQTATEVADGVVTPSDLSTGHPTWDTSGNVGIGTSSPSAKLDVVGQLNATTAYIKSGGSSILYYDGALDVSRVGVGSQFGVDTSGNFKFASGYGSVATAYGCRAWVNFNGQGTVAIRASGNVSSITDAGTGNYRVNFTTAMPDGNYSAVGTINNNQGINYAGEITFADGDVSASQVRVFTSISSGSSLFDPSIVCVSIFR